MHAIPTNFLIAFKIRACGGLLIPTGFCFLLAEGPTVCAGLGCAETQILNKNRRLRRTFDSLIPIKISIAFKIRACGGLLIPIDFLG